ncbi:MAG: tetratricopeptide repeat protein [Planctomycetota bacterium]|jgi:tetratricopeptide (TPR) repeat protein
MKLSRASGRFRWLLIIICLTFVQSGFAGFKKKGKIGDRTKLEQTDLKKIMARPKAYIGRKITFLCRFGFASNFFKTFNTKYTRREYTNFSIWDDEVKLWDKEDRRTVLPSLYISVSRKSVIEGLLKLRKYELTLITAEITSSYGGIPWFDVTGIKSKDWEDTRPTDTGMLHIRHGVSLEKEKKHLLAAEHFKMALGSGLPEDYAGYVNMNLGKSYFNAEEYVKAEKALKQAEEIDEKDSTLKLLLAEINLKRGKYQDAVKYCKEALKISAANPEVYAVMGECLGRNGDVEGGLRQCSLAINNPGISPEGKAMAEVHKARVYVSAKRYNEAVRAYAGAIGVTSPLASAAWLRKEIGRLYEERYIATGDTALLKEAVREYKNAATITKEKDVESLYLLASGYFKEAQAANSTNYQKSVDLINKINLIDSADISSLVLAAKIAEVQGDTKAAESIYSRVVNENPTNPDAYLAVARVYESSGKKALAADAYEKALGLNPSSTTALRKLAELNESIGKLDAAKENYKKLIDLDKAETLYSLKLAAICLITGDYNTAIDQGRKASATASQAVEAGTIVSTAMEAKGDLAGAENQMETIMQKAQGNAAVRARRAFLLAELGKDLQTGIELAKSAVAAEPDNVKAIDALGWVQHKLGNQEDALKTLKGILAANRDRSVWYHLGVVEHAMKNYDDAESALENAIKPILATEIKAIAERIKKAAEKLLPEIKSEKEEAEHQNELKKKVNALRKKEEERVLKEAMEKARKEASKDVESVFEEARLPEKTPIIDAKINNREAEVLNRKTKEEVKNDALSEKISLIDAEEFETGEEPTPEIIEDKISFKAKFDELEEEIALLYPEKFKGPELEETEVVEKQEFALCWPSGSSAEDQKNIEAADSMLAAMAGPELDDAEEVLLNTKDKSAESLKSLPSNDVVILPEWTF